MNETTVLCLTIQNAKYPITLVNFGFCFLDLQISNPLIFFNIQDIIRKICSITGQLLRICILRKRAIQVLVEFDSIETARRIKNELDGVCFIETFFFFYYFNYSILGGYLFWLLYTQN
jgi:hypothetical protein